MKKPEVPELPPALVRSMRAAREHFDVFKETLGALEREQPNREQLLEKATLAKNTARAALNNAADEFRELCLGGADLRLLRNATEALDRAAEPPTPLPKVVKDDRPRCGCEGCEANRKAYRDGVMKLACKVAEDALRSQLSAPGDLRVDGDGNPLMFREGRWVVQAVDTRKREVTATIAVTTPPLHALVFKCAACGTGWEAPLGLLARQQDGLVWCGGCVHKHQAWSESWKPIETSFAQRVTEKVRRARELETNEWSGYEVTTAVGALMLHYVPEVAGKVMTAQSVNEVTGLKLCEGERVTWEAYNQIRDALERRELLGGKAAPAPPYARVGDVLGMFTPKTAKLLEQLTAAAAPLAPTLLESVRKAEGLLAKLPKPKTTLRDLLKFPKHGSVGKDAIWEQRFRVNAPGVEDVELRLVRYDLGSARIEPTIDVLGQAPMEGLRRGPPVVDWRVGLSTPATLGADGVITIDVASSITQDRVTVGHDPAVHGHNPPEHLEDDELDEDLDDDEDE